MQASEVVEDNFEGRMDRNEELADPDVIDAD